MPSHTHVITCCIIWKRVLSHFLAMMGKVTALTMALCTWRHCFLAHSVLEKGVSHLLAIPGKVTAPPSSPAYLVTLFPDPFGPGKGDWPAGGDLRARKRSI